MDALCQYRHGAGNNDMMPEYKPFVILPITTSANFLVRHSKHTAFWRRIFMIIVLGFCTLRPHELMRILQRLIFYPFLCALLFTH